MKKLNVLLLGAIGISGLSGCVISSEQTNFLASDIFNSNVSGAAFNRPINKAYAHWLSPKLVLLPQSESSSNTLFVGGKSPQALALSSVVMPAYVAEKFPHLAGFQAFELSANVSDIKQWIKQPLLVKRHIAGSDEYSQVQIGNLIDALYTTASNDADEISDLGAVISASGTTFKLWAPTAQRVSLLLSGFDKTRPAHKLAMNFDPVTGAWQYQSAQALKGHYYQYEISVYHPKTQRVETIVTTDPYSLSLSENSQFSQVVDLADTSTKPDGWDTQADNKVLSPLDNIFYETHIGDFSNSDESVSEISSQGKYAAFSEQNSDGIKHLKSLRSAGINTIHLLPTFDIGTVNESSATVLSLDSSLDDLCQRQAQLEVCKPLENNTTTIKQYLQSLTPLSSTQQQVVSAIRQDDNYNWGYDPFHYTVPEGSYALNPDGVARIKEFRQMVMSLHNLGFRVVMDVVYNHTHQAGLAKTAVLDKIVPAYYHRLDPLSGEIAQSTCCDNTATERAMMEKLMIDSLVTWAKDYKIDGFRFDLMAHQPKDAMLRAREAVWTVDSDNYFYGEGWNFGEVANNQRFIQASQLELGGTQIGTFTDRLRDAVRGGAFSASGDDIRSSQGIGSGLVTSPNELAQASNADDYLLKMDQLRISLAGNLRHFPLTDRHGESVTGQAIPYGDQPTGYALEPADTINYVSKHDNQTLWDNNQYRLPYNMSAENRVRLHVQSLSYPLFAQGIPFIHMGSELLRSKSFLRDSYDYGEWFNRVDFSKQSNNYNVGLPPADKDKANWSLIEKLIAKNEGRDHVDAANIAFSDAVFKEFVAIRMTNLVFRLTTAKEIIEQVSFLNAGKEQQQGMIAMAISAAPNTSQQSVVVVFNASDAVKEVPLAQAINYQLHSVQENGVDSIVKQAKTIDGALLVPAYSTAVFVEK